MKYLDRSSHYTVYFEELEGNDLACQVTLNYEASKVAIFTNNMTSIEATACPKNSSGQHIRAGYAPKAQSSLELEISVKLHWIPAHHRMERQEQESLCLEIG